MTPVKVNNSLVGVVKRWMLKRNSYQKKLEEFFYGHCRENSTAANHVRGIGKEKRLLIGRLSMLNQENDYTFNDSGGDSEDMRGVPSSGRESYVFQANKPEGLLGVHADLMEKALHRTKGYFISFMPLSGQRRKYPLDCMRRPHLMLSQFQSLDSSFPKIDTRRELPRQSNQSLLVISFISSWAASSNLQVFAQKTKKYWERTICSHCVKNGSFHRCRRHLVEDASNAMVGDISFHRGTLEYIFEHLVIYARSFRWECHGTDTEEDQAALISAIGWCSGWGPLLSILEMK